MRLLAWSYDPDFISCSSETKVLLAQIMENKTLRKLVGTRSEEVQLIEHRRAHNICIELAGIRLPFPAIKVRRPCSAANRHTEKCRSEHRQ